MLELLTSSSRKPGKSYPNSGPGPIVLEYGDEDLGYFGTLTSSEMFTATELLNHLDIKGSSYIDSPTWVKCFINGRILFTPTQRLVSGVIWSDLYKAGAVYGDRTVGTYPPGDPVLQDAVIIKGSHAFSIRIWGRGDKDPTTYAPASYPAPADMEYLKFITKFFDGTHSSFNGSWKLFSTNGIGSAIQQMFSLQNVTNFGALYYAAGNVAGQLQQALKTNGTVWWPVLEPINFSEQLLPIKAVNNQPLDDTLLSQIAITSLTSEIATPEDGLKPISVNGLRYDTVEPKPVAITSAMAEPDADWLKPISYGSIKQPVSLLNIAITSLKYEA